MRILTLTNLYPNAHEPNRAPFNRQQFQALAERHTVAVISPIAWTDELWARMKGLPPLAPDRRVVRDGLTVDYPRYYFPPKLLRRYYGHCFTMSIRRTFRRILADLRPEIIFAAWAYPDGWAAVKLGRAAGLPVVIKIHGSDVLKVLEHPAREKRTVEALCHADGIVAVSRDLAAKAVAYGVAPPRIRVVYDGIDHDRFYPGNAVEARRRLGLATDIPLILFVGRLVEGKGIEILIKACARLARNGVRFACEVVGPGPLHSSLQRQINAHRLEALVRLRGVVSHGALPDWYRAATVFALPSYSEGVPTVLLEALACGIPCASTTVGGIPEITHLGATCLTAPGDEEALTVALSESLAGTYRGWKQGHSLIRSHAAAAEELSSFFGEILHSRARSGMSEQPREESKSRQLAGSQLLA